MNIFNFEDYIRLNNQNIISQNINMIFKNINFEICKLNNIEINEFKNKLNIIQDDIINLKNDMLNEKPNFNKYNNLSYQISNLDVKIKNILSNKMKDEIEKIIIEHPKKSFEFKNYINSNKKLLYDDICILISKIYIKNNIYKFNIDTLIKSEIGILNSKNEDELLTNIDKNKIIALLFQNREIDYIKNIIMKNNPNYSLNKEKYDLKFNVILMKLVPFIFFSDLKIANKLILYILNGEYKNEMVYYYTKYFFEYFKNIKLITIIKNKEKYLDILFSKINEIFIDENDKYCGLLSIKLLNQTMGYNDDNLLEEESFDFFKTLVNQFSKLKNSILLNLHFLHVLNYGIEIHIDYLYEKYEDDLNNNFV